MDNSKAIYPSLHDSSVFVTGGASGIGAAIVEAFTGQGSRVFFVDIDAGAGNKLCDRLQNAGLLRPTFDVIDATDVEALAAVVRKASVASGSLDILINNVGNDTRQVAEEVSPDSWRKMLAVNLDSAFFAAQAAAPALEKSGGGSIVNLSSVQTILGSANMVSYVTAKSGLLGLTKALASDYGPKNIRVNAITPGWVLTERQRQLWATPTAVADWQDHSRLQGELKPEHIASMALFLGSAESRMITAQNFVVDAGRS
jgi:NAD(P)-dependent dehydrogenase (short-subunit alcohol dehydrogenase family)